MIKVNPERKKQFYWTVNVICLAVIIIIFFLAAPVAAGMYGGTGGGASGSISGSMYAEFKHSEPKPPLPPGQAEGTYPVGFSGMNFNADHLNTLELDLGAARTANAEVTTYPDRVEVYQHGSPAVLITFWGKGFEYKDGKVVGKVTRSEFVTSPFAGNISEGDVTGSVRVVLYALVGRADLTKTIDANATADVNGLFRDAAARLNLEYDATAFTLNITKVRLEQTGAANLTFTVPTAWVTSHGGAGSVRIVRISEKDRSTGIIDTRYLGQDTKGAMKFEAYSPDGTSVFGMITTKALTEKHIEPQKGQISTDVGMLVWISQMGSNNIYLFAVVVIAALGVFYIYTTKQKRSR